MGLMLIPKVEMNNIYSNFIEGIGNTPLIRLNGPSRETGCNIFGKAEYLNPGGSIKDRAALAIIKEAEEKNILKEGGTIIEGTAGNTGIGLTLIPLLVPKLKPSSSINLKIKVNALTSSML